MNKIIEMQFGSHLYGTNTANSDLDFKGIYLPSSRDVLLGKITGTFSAKIDNVNEKKEIDIYSLDKFLHFLSTGQAVALDMLFTPVDKYVLVSEMGIQIINDIYTNRFLLLSKKATAMLGYAEHQIQQYGMKGKKIIAIKTLLEKLKRFNDSDRIFYIKWYEIIYPTQELRGLIDLDANNLVIFDKKISLDTKISDLKMILNKMYSQYGERAHKAAQADGADWKALSHGVRLYYQTEELLDTGKITFPRPEADLLIKIKLGELEHKEVLDILSEKKEQIEKSQEKSILRENVDLKWIEDLTYNVYSGIVKRGE